MSLSSASSAEAAAALLIDAARAGEAVREETSEADAAIARSSSFHDGLPSYLRPAAEVSAGEPQGEELAVGGLDRALTASATSSEKPTRSSLPRYLQEPGMSSGPAAAAGPTTLMPGGRGAAAPAVELSERTRAEGQAPVPAPNRRGVLPTVARAAKPSTDVGLRGDSADRRRNESPAESPAATLATPSTMEARGGAVSEQAEPVVAEGGVAGIETRGTERTTAAGAEVASPAADGLEDAAAGDAGGETLQEAEARSAEVESGDTAPRERGAGEAEAEEGEAEAGTGEAEAGEGGGDDAAGEGAERAGGGAGPTGETQEPEGGAAIEESVEAGGDLALIDEELAEHERWAGSFGEVGTAGSDQRARFLLDQAGQGGASGAAGAAGMGFVMGAIGAGVGQIAGRRLAQLAVSRGALATPIPGLGPAIGGVMAVAGLAMRDWGATAETISRFGTGEGYEGLANDLEAVAEALDVATQIMDVLAGVLGAIAVGMWVAAVISAGTLSPLAATLSAIATGIGIATTAVGVIINFAIRPTVVALRALHTFESQGDPAQIEAEGQQLQAAAGQVTGAVVGAGAGRLGGAAGTRGGARADRAVSAVQARRTGGGPELSATAGPGPRIHVEVPEAPRRADADAAGTPVRTETAEGGTPTPLRPAAAEGPAARSPGSGEGRPLQPLEQGPHPVTPDIVITGDFSDPALSVLRPRGRKAGSADVGDIGPHRRQGRRGTTMISEHVIPGAQMRDATIDPTTGTPDWRRTTPSGSDAADYRNATTIIEHAPVAARKTALDNPATRALQGQGGPRNLTEDLLLPSLERHQRAVDDAIAAGEITPDQATDPTHRALAALAEMWGGGSSGGSARARADAEATGTRLSQPRRADRRRAVEAERAQARLADEDVAGFDDYDWDATFGAGTPAASGTSGPAASSPVRSPSAAAATPPPGGYVSHTETMSTSSRSDAMAQYHTQISADPGRESGVWRDADGNYYVMQGDTGSVAPPTASSPLELIYHSHPTTADTGYQGVVSQPSQAAGDLGVLQYQHGQGPAGRRQSSELHFPTYDPSGTHTGYGTTQFAYDPTHPLPLQVETTLPGGRPSRQRYASFADFEQRTGIAAGGTTPADSASARSAADVQLTADVAAAQQRMSTIVEGTQTRPGGLPVMREAAEYGRQQAMGEEVGPERPEVGPAYTAAVPGMEPGTSIEVPINPPYPEPPGTPAELAALREQARIARGVQQDLRGTERSMERQAHEQRTHGSGLEEAQGVAGDLESGRTVHQGAVEETQSTNTEQQSTAGEAISSIGRTAEEATGLATLVTSLQAFRGMAHLFSYLPGDLGRKAGGAREDAARLITTLNRVSDAESTQANIEGGREQIQANEGRIESVSTIGEETDAELTGGREQLTELQMANEESLAETEAVDQQAATERRDAEANEQEAQNAHEDLQARLQTWAQEHRQAREDAIEQAMTRYSELGYEVEEG